MEPVRCYDPDAPVPPTRLVLVWCGVKAWLALTVLAVLVLAIPFNTIWYTERPTEGHLADAAALKRWAKTPPPGPDPKKVVPANHDTVRAATLWMVLGVAVLLGLVAVRYPSAVWRVGKVTLLTLFVCWQLFFLAFRNPVDLWEDDFKKWAAKKWSKEWEQIEPYLDKYFKPLDKLTTGYARFAGVEQGWSMFTPNMARGCSFLAARIEFTDGTEAVLRSPNEPAWEADDVGLARAAIALARDPNDPKFRFDGEPPKPFKPKPFFRIGCWRHRKLEDALAFASQDDLPSKDDLPLYQRYVRWSVRRWQEANPGDKRKVFRVVLIRRRFEFPHYQEGRLVFGLTNWFKEMPPADESQNPQVYREPEVYTIGHFNPDGTLRP
jgi:hypothetical protein